MTVKFNSIRQHEEPGICQISLIVTFNEVGKKDLALTTLSRLHSKSINITDSIREHHSICPIENGCRFSGYINYIDTISSIILNTSSILRAVSAVEI